MIRRLEVLVLMLLAIVAAVAPGWADDVATMSIGSPLRVSGVVSSVTTNSVVLSCPSGPMTVPLAYTSLTAGAARVGMSLNLTISPFSGSISVVDDRCVTVLTPQGYCTLPVVFLPEDVTRKTRVYVRKNNGNIVAVPLNAALNMRRAQGVTILGATRPGVVVPHQVPVNGEPGGDKKGGGKGHGKGKK